MKKCFAILPAAVLCLLAVSAFVPEQAHAVTPGYYAPFGSISSNIECKNGYKYSKQNMNSGICRVNWNTVIGNTINSTINAGIAGGLGHHLP